MHRPRCYALCRRHAEIDGRLRSQNMKSSLMLAIGFICLLAATPIVAHHSFAAQYDRSKPNMITGPVTKIEWINPHARFFIDVKDAGGKIVNWEVELGPPAGLMRRGWTRNSLKVGETVTVDGFFAKTGVLTSQMPAPCRS